MCIVLCVLCGVFGSGVVVALLRQWVGGTRGIPAPAVSSSGFFLYWDVGGVLWKLAETGTVANKQISLNITFETSRTLCVRWVLN